MEFDTTKKQIKKKISKRQFKKKKPVKYYNCGKPGYIKRNCRQPNKGNQRTKYTQAIQHIVMICLGNSNQKDNQSQTISGHRVLDTPKTGQNLRNITAWRCIHWIPKRYIRPKGYRLYLLHPLYPLNYIVSAMRTQGVSYLIFLIFYSYRYQLPANNNLYFLSAPYSSIETNLIWEILIRRISLLSLIIQ